MYFLKADDIAVFGKSSEIIMFQFAGDLRGSHRPNKTSSIPGNTSKTAIRNMDTCVPIKANSLYSRWLKSEKNAQRGGEKSRLKQGPRHQAAKRQHSKAAGTRNKPDPLERIGQPVLTWSGSALLLGKVNIEKSRLELLEVGKNHQIHRTKWARWQQQGPATVQTGNIGSRSIQTRVGRPLAVQKNTRKKKTAPKQNNQKVFTSCCGGNNWKLGSEKKRNSKIQRTISKLQIVCSGLLPTFV